MHIKKISLVLNQVSAIANEDRLFVRLGYRIQKQQWRKNPFGYQLDLNVNYSITQKAFSFKFDSVYNKVDRAMEPWING